MTDRLIGRDPKLSQANAATVPQKADNRYICS
jgi:hypothetical protein